MMSRPGSATPSPLIGADGALGGWAARWWRGARYCDGIAYDGTPWSILLHTSERFRRRRRQMVEPSRCALHPDEVGTVNGVRVTTLARAAYDDARNAPSLLDAVTTLEMSVSTVIPGATRTTLAAIGRVFASHHKTRGRRQAQLALELAMDRSASPLETQTRLFAMWEVGLNRLLVNVAVFDRTSDLLGIVDLLDPETGLVVESDGATHRTPQQSRRDNIRVESLARANLTVVRVTRGDHREPGRLRWRLLDGDRRARARDPRRDAWTLTKPKWWATSTLAQRWG